MRSVEMLPLLVLILLISLLAGCPSALADSIPESAQQYKTLLIRSAHAELGLNAPIATLAAQVHQESRWQKNAVSAVGAKGLAQFMPATAQWMPNINQNLADVQPNNPAWALRAMASYDHWLKQRTTPAANACEHWAFILSSYNGGLGWFYKDRKQAQQNRADTQRWFNAIEGYNAGRSPAAFKENRDYVSRILKQHEPLYLTWGQGVCQ